MSIFVCQRLPNHETVNSNTNLVTCRAIRLVLQATFPGRETRTGPNPACQTGAS
jgi:hypothetical protein